MTDRVLAAWGAFLRPSFDEVLAAGGVTVVTVPGNESPVDVAPDCDALYVRLPQYASADVIAALPNLKALAVPGAGIEVIDVEAATARGVPVLSGQGMGPEPVADWTIGSVIWLVRRMGELHEAMKAGDWKRRFDTEHRHDVRAVTVGVIGFGQIGRRVAHVLDAGFGSTVLVNDELPRACDAARAQGFEVVEPDELVRRSDIVSLHAQARHGEPPLLDRRRIGLMKRGACVVNTARGALLDYDALEAALASGALGGAALDVHPVEPPPQDYVDRFAAFPNVLLSPHQGGMTVDATEALSVGVAGSIVELLDGGRPANCANPEVWERAGAGAARAR
jgi:D-3-phosphoglycerate dehydrogenase